MSQELSYNAMLRVRELRAKKAQTLQEIAKINAEMRAILEVGELRPGPIPVTRSLIIDFLRTHPNASAKEIGEHVSHIRKKDCSGTVRTFLQILKNEEITTNVNTYGKWRLTDQFSGSIQPSPEPESLFTPNELRILRALMEFPDHKADMTALYDKFRDMERDERSKAILALTKNKYITNTVADTASSRLISMTDHPALEELFTDSKENETDTNLDT